MVNTKQLANPVKILFSFALLLISASILLSSCSGTKGITGCRNAPRSLFAANQKHTNKNADPKKYAGNKAPGATVSVNGFTNTSLQKQHTDSANISQQAVSILPGSGSKTGNDIKNGEKKKNLSNKDIASTKSFNGKKVYNRFRTKQPEQKQTDTPPTPKTEPMAIAAFICGLVGLVFLPAGICAIVFGFSSLSKINRQPDVYNGSGFAIAGIICGFLGILFTIIFLLVVLIVVAAIFSMM